MKQYFRSRKHLGGNSNFTRVFGDQRGITPSRPNSAPAVKDNKPLRRFRITGANCPKETAIQSNQIDDNAFHSSTIELSCSTSRPRSADVFVQSKNENKILPILPSNEISWKVQDPPKQSTSSHITRSDNEIEMEKASKICKNLLRQKYEGKSSLINIFRMWDKNKDGHVSVEEVGEMMDSLGFGRVVGQDNVRLFLKQLQVEMPNGYLTFDRFQSLIYSNDSTGVDSSKQMSGYQYNQAILPSTVATTLTAAASIIPTNSYEDVLQILRQKYERTRLKQSFRQWDINKDGFISREEARDCLDRLGVSLTKDAFSELFSTCDLDKDNALDFREFNLMIRGPIHDSHKRLIQKKKQDISSGYMSFDSYTTSILESKKSKQQNMSPSEVTLLKRQVYEKLKGMGGNGLVEAFHLLDEDDSGKITYLELREGFKRLGVHLTGKEFHAFVSSMDQDKDGTIDFMEFQKCLKETELHLSISLSHDQKQKIQYVKKSNRFLSPESKKGYDFKRLSQSRTTPSTRRGNTPLHSTKDLLSLHPNHQTFTTESESYGKSKDFSLPHAERNKKKTNYQLRLIQLRKQETPYFHSPSFASVGDNFEEHRYQRRLQSIIGQRIAYYERLRDRIQKDIYNTANTS